MTLRSSFGGEPFLAEHSAPQTTTSDNDLIDHAFWRHADILEACALHRVGCDADLTMIPDPDGAPVTRATVTREPVDFGPFPAVLAECDAVFGPTLNSRIARCGPTRL